MVRMEFTKGRCRQAAAREISLQSQRTPTVGPDLMRQAAYHATTRLLVASESVPPIRTSLDELISLSRRAIQITFMRKYSRSRQIRTAAAAMPTAASSAPGARPTGAQLGRR